MSLIDPKNPRDPIALQFIPREPELFPDTFNYQKVWENDKDFLDGANRLLQQKYPDIVVMRLANTCHSHCRFCFEKERTIKNNVRTLCGPAQIAAAIKIIRNKKKLRQVLLSGGDPLILPDHFIKNILEKLIQIPHLKTLRINTRALLQNPFRITEEFARMLGDIQNKSWKSHKNTQNKLPRGKQIQVGTHFNHPKELTPEAITAIRRLQSKGIEIYNQTVLLKNINDDSKILQKLFHKLREEGVRLHYLSHAQPVPGTPHFRTKINKGLEILKKLKQTKEFRGQLPHYEFSHYKGKQLPNVGEKLQIKNNSISFLSDTSDKWETYPDGE